MRVRLWLIPQRASLVGIAFECALRDERFDMLEHCDLAHLEFVCDLLHRRRKALRPPIRPNEFEDAELFGCEVHVRIPESDDGESIWAARVTANWCFGDERN